MTQEIHSRIPHRHPFLFIDRVLEVEAGARVLAEKLVTAQEAFFQGHFPSNPVMPGVLMVEMLAQAAGFLDEGEPLGGPVFLAQILDARFKAPVKPGDRLLAEVSLDARFGSLIRVAGVIKCDGRPVCTARILLKKASS